MFTNDQILDTLQKLADARPGKYDSDNMTPHKVVADLSYSYDDCIVGCLVRELAPEVHEKLLNAESATGEAFGWGDGPAVRSESIINALSQARALFTDEQNLALAHVQDRQDYGVVWELMPSEFLIALDVRDL